MQETHIKTAVKRSRSTVRPLLACFGRGMRVPSKYELLELPTELQNMFQKNCNQNLSEECQVFESAVIDQKINPTRISLMCHIDETTDMAIAT